MILAIETGEVDYAGFEEISLRQALEFEDPEKGPKVLIIPNADKLVFPEDGPDIIAQIVRFSEAGKTVVLMCTHLALLDKRVRRQLDGSMTMRLGAIKDISPDKRYSVTLRGL